MFEPMLKTIGPDIYAFIGVNGDSNAGAVLLSDGLLAIDAQQSPEQGLRFRNAIEAAAGRRVTQLIDTHLHLDHTAGNVMFEDVPIIAHRKTLELMRDYAGAAPGDRWRIADDDDKFRLFFGSNARELVPPGDPLEDWFLTRMNRPGIETIELVGPTETFDEHMTFARHDGALHANYCGPAHCDGDLVLHLPREKIVFLGDLLFVGRYPWLGDCDLDGWITLLQRVLALDVDTVVPGHGDICSRKDVAAFRDLLMALREAVQRAVKAGASEEAAVREVEVPAYAATPRYREWRAPNIRAVYRYLRRS